MDIGNIPRITTYCVTDRPLAHLSDETLDALVENGRQLEKGSGAVVDEDGLVITESLE